MKKLLSIIVIIIIFTSCGTTYHGMSGGNGCGVWYPRKFEKDKRYQRNSNWINNPKSGRYRSMGF